MDYQAHVNAANNSLYPSHVLVDVKVLEELRDSALWLECLETAGVDNWEGFDDAADLYRRVKDGKEEL